MEIDIAYTIYYLVLIPIINDDIVLLKWLYSKNLDLLESNIILN